MIRPKTISTNAAAKLCFGCQNSRNFLKDLRRRKYSCCGDEKDMTWNCRANVKFIVVSCKKSGECRYVRINSSWSLQQISENIFDDGSYEPWTEVSNLHWGLFVYLKAAFLVFLISLLNSWTGVIYVIPPVIYLALNKTIREDCRMLYMKAFKRHRISYIDGITVYQRPIATVPNRNSVAAAPF
uniref:Uncharacterized protein n=1 Tax=Globodera rostochiensis TaxID=31243 RepID=A0A914GRT5_GLORO